MVSRRGCERWDDGQHWPGKASNHGRLCRWPTGSLEEMVISLKKMNISKFLKMMDSFEDDGQFYDVDGLSYDQGERSAILGYDINEQAVTRRGHIALARAMTT